MHRISALVVSLLVILNCRCSSVSGLPTQEFEAVINSVLPTPGPLETCYGLEPEGTRILQGLQELAVDSEGRQCYKLINKRNVKYLFNQTQLEGTYANLTAESCPTWLQNKQCLFDHLNSEKCNEANRNVAKDAAILGLEVVLAEMLCNPKSPNYLLQLLKNTSDAGMWNCLTRDDAMKLLMNCDTESFDENDKTFASLRNIFKCLKPGIRKCAGGDPVKEVKLVELWDEFDETLQEHFVRFWRQLNT